MMLSSSKIFLKGKTMDNSFWIIVFGFSIMSSSFWIKFWEYLFSVLFLGDFRIVNESLIFLIEPSYFIKFWSFSLLKELPFKVSDFLWEDVRNEPLVDFVPNELFNFKLSFLDDTMDMFFLIKFSDFLPEEAWLISPE